MALLTQAGSAQPTVSIPPNLHLRQWPAMLAAMAVFATLSALAAVKSDGFLEADGCVHYEYARFAFHEPHLLTNVWGRPFCTGIYSIPAVIGGLIGVRIASLLIALSIGLITYRIAKNQGYVWPGLAMIFLLGQPIVFLHSFSELTELPFALLLALAFWAYQGRQWFWMAMAAAWLPTSRPEGFGFLILAAVALVLHRRTRYLPLLIVPLVLWSVFGWLLVPHEPPWYTQIPLWLPKHWPYSTDSAYGHGWLGHFIVMLPAIVSPAVFPALLLGLWQSLKSRRSTPYVLDAMWDSIFGTDHRTRVQWLIAILPLGILAGHSLLFWAGRMASNGELRYLTVVAPMWALLAAKGWEWAFIRFNWRSALGWAGFAVVVPALANVAYRVIPLRMDADWKRSQAIVQWYEQSEFHESYPLLIGTHPGVKYFQGVSPTDPKFSVEWNRKTAENPPWGSILIWDPMYSQYNADTSRILKIEDLERSGWVRARVFPKEYLKPIRPGKLAMLMYRIKRPILAMFGKEVVSPADQPAKEVVGEWFVYLGPKDRHGRPTMRPTTVPEN